MLYGNHINIGKCFLIIEGISLNETMDFRPKRAS